MKLSRRISAGVISFTMVGTQLMYLPSTILNDTASINVPAEGIESIVIPNKDVFTAMVTSAEDENYYSGSCGENATFVFDEETGTLTISGTGDMENCSSYGEMPWNDYIENIKAIVIEDGITSIGISAFRFCESLESVTIANSVTFIDSCAFQYCEALESINIPDSVTSIGEGAFGYCTSLTSVTIPDSVTSIGKSAFSSCTSLTSVTIPNSVTSIGKGAFESCTSLTSVTIPNSVTSIGWCAFGGCYNLIDVYFNGTESEWNKISIDDDNIYLINALNINLIDKVIENSSIITGSCDENIKYSLDRSTGILTIGCIDDIKTKPWENPNYIIEDRPWYDYKENIKTVVIEDGITSIGQMAFQYCESLTSVTIPDSVTSIGDDAFIGCTSLESITIPDSVTEIGFYAFYNCESLTSVTIPDSVTSIGERAFADCTSLENVTIPYSVTEIGNLAFDGCTSLTSVTILDGVTTIGDGEFYNCESLTSITIPDSVTYIGNNAFSYCTSLESINFPDSVTYIGDCAFYGTKISDDMIPIRFKFNILNGVLVSYNGSDDITNIVIPNNVTSIGVNVFYYFRNLESVTIPNSVTSIDDGAFQICPRLKEVTIPSSVTSIGEYAFGYLKGTSVGGKISNFTIYGVVGTEAERYAIDNGFNFVAIEEETSPTTEKPTITDILNLKKYILGITTDGTGLDLNLDGTINILDLTIVLNSINK